jgi:hypothetical protein
MTPKQEKALREYLQEAIVPLIEQVLVKKLGQAMTFAAEELMQPKREWQGLTEQEIGVILEDINAFGTRLYTFTRAIEAKLKEKNT